MIKSQVNIFSFVFVFVIASTILSIAHAQTSPRVNVTDRGAVVVMENNRLTATIQKATAKIVSVKLNGDELLGNGGHGYLQVVVDGKFSTPEDTRCRIVRNNGRIAELSHRWKVGPLAFDLHYVLKAGDSGIYSFLSISYDPQKAGCIIQQLSYALRTDKEIFHQLYVDDNRVFDMPSPEDIKAGETLLPVEATRLKNGDIHHKYNFSKYAMDDALHGWTGHGKGNWIIASSNEYMNGGPTTQELIGSQSATTPVTLKVLHGAHYGSGTTALDSTDGRWRKLLGPWLMYFNEGDADVALADAKKRLAKEQTAWPYHWMRHKDYPRAQQRGTVSGKLNRTDGTTSQNALVILAKPTDGTPDTNWQRQAKDYLFWAQTDQNGAFKIKHVRPGTYTLYAFTSGVLDEYRLDGVEVSRRETQALGALSWTPKRYGKQVWQIGTPDRTASEFRHGDDFRKWGLWLNYPDDFPNGVRYVIGQSAPQEDWNFNQWCVADGFDKKGNLTYKTSPWSIEFEVEEIVDEMAYLTVAIAASRQARLRVLVNGTEVFTDSFINDSAGPRAGIQGFYQARTIPFSTTLLKAGQTNQIVLEQRRLGMFPSIMYDCIRLETGDSQ